MELAVRDTRLTQRVGAAALIVLAGLFVLLQALDRFGWRSGVRATIYFTEVGGLQEGAEVRVAGQKIGDVIAIALVPRPSAPPGHPLHDSGGSAVIVDIDREHIAMAPRDGEYFITTRGTFGDRYLAIGPARPETVPRGEGEGDGERTVPPGETAQASGRLLRDGDAIRGVDPPNIDRALWRSYRNLSISKKFLDDLVPEGRAFASAFGQLVTTLGSLAPDGHGLHESRAAIAGLVDEIATLRSTLDQSDVTAADLERLAARGRATLELAEQALAGLRGQLAIVSADIARLRGITIPDETRARLVSSFERAERTLATLETTVGRVKELVAMVLRGDGTIGAILRDPEFPEDSKQLGRMLKRHPWRLLGLGRDKQK